MAHRLLVVEDDPHVGTLYAHMLSRHRGFSWRLVRTLGEARRALSRERPDALLLDWMLPDGEGLQLIREIRASDELRQLLVFVVTGRAASEDCVAALDTGADDFMAKPFDAEVLLARLDALARRKERVWGRAGSVTLEGLTLDPEAASVRLRGREVRLHPKELRLLEFLLRHPDVVHPSERLWESVWGRRSAHWQHVLAATLSCVRRALGPWADRIENRRGLGYILVAGR